MKLIVYKGSTYRRKKFKKAGGYSCPKCDINSICSESMTLRCTKLDIKKGDNGYFKAIKTLGDLIKHV